MKVIYLLSAERRLKEVIDYVENDRGQDKAVALLLEIHGRINELEQYPRLGAIEELMTHLPFEYRRLVIAPYKVIYRIEDELIMVTDVFDSRRDPSEMLG